MYLVLMQIPLILSTTVYVCGSKLVITRDGKKLHLFGHLLRNKIAEIIAKIAQKIARKIEKLHGVLDNQNFYSNLMFFKVVVFMKKVRKITIF